MKIYIFTFFFFITERADNSGTMPCSPTVYWVELDAADDLLPLLQQSTILSFLVFSTAQWVLEFVTF